MLSRLRGCGLLPDDPRIQEALAGLTATEGASKQISFGQFKVLAKHNSSLIQRAVEGNLAVPDFPALSSDIERMYGELLPVRSGSVADYIPQLRRVDPDQLAIAVCTVDGQRFSVGDAATAFSLQSVSKTVSYCLALDEHGTEAVHEHVGREPSGRSFNELALNPKGLPHNPMVNAGGIMTCSLIRPGWDIADRFDLVAATWRRLAGGGRAGSTTRCTCPSGRPRTGTSRWAIRCGRAARSARAPTCSRRWSSSSRAARSRWTRRCWRWRRPRWPMPGCAR